MRNPQHILITGASSGIGAALAARYAAPHIWLSLHGRSLERITKVAKAAEQAGATVSFKADDVTDAASLRNWIDERDRLKPIDLLIANAGISAGTGGGLESVEQITKIFAVNLQGVLNTIQPAIPLMRRRGRGQIALISSLAGFIGLGGAPAYGASKAAVRVYGEALRSELGPRGIEVNVICPGFIKTPMTDANHFPMPFLMSAERAALIIQKGLSKNQGRIAFPLPMYFLIRCFSALPQVLRDLLAVGLPKKGG